MADKPRFVVHDHYVVDTTKNRHSPFGAAEGAELMAELMNVEPANATRFAWVAGRPKGFNAREAKQ